MKRFFGGMKRSKQAIESEGKNRNPNPDNNHTSVPFEEKKYSGDKISCESSGDTNKSSNLKPGATKKASKLSFRSSLKKELRLKEGNTKDVPTIISETQNRSKNSLTESTRDPPGKRGSVLKRTDDDESVASSKKSGLEGAGRKVNFNLNGEVEEVIVTQSGVQDRHSTISRAYDSIPLLEQTKLPRGGISIETKAVGRVQFGIPPETIKDSMRLGIPVPQIYIVPAERFCREMGPALGVNLAEFEFPGYFNFFIRQINCTLVVDSQDAEDNICRVFEETLLGPKQFRREVAPLSHDEQDFAPDFPREAIPNFQRELGHFRDLGGGRELTVDLILKFCHFLKPDDGCYHDNLGVPPNLDVINDDEVNDLVQQDYDEAVEEFDEAEKEEENETKTAFEGKGGQREEEKMDARDKSKWSYGRARWVGDVATVWPPTATDEEKGKRCVPRVEIFKMPSGTEYIIHDVNADNIVIGRARFSGSVKVNESIGLEGFGDKSLLDELDDIKDHTTQESGSVAPKLPPSFYPPSFGVTILGNSHGFDPSGSVSGYVLWINGRGLMIDPPPYASATLEREGIRPRTIVAIILTHTHSDHDAGAFQKVLTGSPVVVITTPTIYKSFIRKYAALASLNAALLLRSHRYKPAVIGEDLRFQGATFKFFYSLHSIPCVGFRVEWRGRSIVFSGDHLHDPVMINKLQEKGVLSKGRADELRQRPLQDTDLLLHEAGVPPLHTTFAELEKLPNRVKKRMYVVHSSNIPEEFDLRKAPTGTDGTLRLDELHTGSSEMANRDVSMYISANASKDKNNVVRFEDDNVNSPWKSAGSESVGEKYSQNQMDSPSDSNEECIGRNSIVKSGRKSSIPFVSMRPSSNTDSWYMLNLLQAVPFLTSLPYTSTMEVLESSRVEAVNKNDIVVPAARRNEILCVIWEGTCFERKARSNANLFSLTEADESPFEKDSVAVWHSGDWTGPIALQPEKRLSGESDIAATHDIVATSKEGVKVITLEFKNLHRILKNGSHLYRKYLKRQKAAGLNSEGPLPTNLVSPTTEKLLREASKKLNILELIDVNAGLRKLTAVQKRHLECLAEGPVAFNPGERLWRAGAPVDKAFLVVAGTASFVVRRNNSVRTPGNSGMLGNFDGGLSSPKREFETALDEIHRESGDTEKHIDIESDENAHIHFNYFFSKKKSDRAKSISDADDFDRLSKTLIKRAESLGRDDNVSIGSSHDEFSQSSDGPYSVDLDEDLDRRKSLTRRRSSRARFVNKALVRLYDRRAFTGGLVFSRGHFLGDVSKMFAGLLSNEGDLSVTTDIAEQGDEPLPSYGFGEKKESKRKENDLLSNTVIHEKDIEGRILHTSTLTAEKEGCIVLVFPRESLTEFLDAHPGLLLSLLGTQVIV
eukprot:CAMPEP_0197189262 /NCGR_PEP_ID=MMETSP1423-20130617/19463_1 /TAXON_ID=476441 /ORGANISM="Pseudo-nitzschia heimii, Strain UNC1101" /LENGTH=1386 /DNA_ID=CAMNT_0042641321 /DNA_START=116 /DNA_END=4279 /DNA_ORIENTATION=+